MRIMYVIWSVVAIFWMNATNNYLEDSRGQFEQRIWIEASSEANPSSMIGNRRAIEYYWDRVVLWTSARTVLGIFAVAFIGLAIFHKKKPEKLNIPLENTPDPNPEAQTANT